MVAIAIIMKTKPTLTNVNLTGVNYFDKYYLAIHLLINISNNHWRLSYYFDISVNVNIVNLTGFISATLTLTLIKVLTAAVEINVKVKLTAIHVNLTVVNYYEWLYQSVCEYIY